MSAVLEEHLGYLRLPHRARLYREAIARIIRPGDVVADLGCGLGVLGIECLKAGAARIYGVDRSDAIELAREIVSKSGLGDRYSCIRASSFQVELPERVDAIICDHVGYFGFDYGIIAMLADARERLLKPGGRIIPQRLDLHVAAISAPRCRELVECWEEPPVPRECAWLREYAANTKHAIVFNTEELAGPAERLGTIDLETARPGAMSFTARLTVSQDCAVDGIGGWFDCQLAPGVGMTNSPLAEESIGRDQVFLPCSQPIAMKAGQGLCVDLRIDGQNDIITWTITPDGGEAQKLSTWKSKILTPQDLVQRLDVPLQLNAAGKARQAILALVDGNRTAREIEELLVASHPALFPSESELRRFIRAELGKDADC